MCGVRECAVCGVFLFLFSFFSLSELGELLEKNCGTWLRRKLDFWEKNEVLTLELEGGRL